MAPGASALGAASTTPPPPAAGAAPTTPPAASPTPTPTPTTAPAQPKIPSAPPPNTTPMMQNGRLGFVPNENVSKAIDQGFEQAIQIQDGSGRKGYVARSKLADAQAQGLKAVSADAGPHLLDNSSGPGSITQTINDPTGFHSGAQGQVEKFGQGALQTVNAVIQHPYTTVKSTLQLPVDALLAMGMKPELAGIETKLGEAPDQQQQNARARLMAQWQAAKDNPAGFIGQQVGGGALLHGLKTVAGTGVGAVVDQVKGAVDSGLVKGKTIAENATGASQAVATEGKKTIAEQNTADRVNAARDKVFKQKVADTVQAANDKNTDAAAKVADWNDQQKLDHATKVADISAENVAEQERVDGLNEDNKAAAQQKYQENVKLAEDTESERGQLARQEIQTRLRLARRVQTLAQSAKGVVSQQFNQVRKAIGDTQVPMEPLADSVKEAQNDFQGSSEKVSQFQDILRKAKGSGADEALRQEVMDSQGIKGDYESLPADHRATVDKIFDAIKSQTQMPDEDPPSINFSNLRGYSSELGRTIHDLRTQNGPGDVIRALNKVKAQADAMSEQMANEAGVGAKLRTAKKNFQTYMDTFKEPTGPSGSGSPVAKSLNAEDAYHATEPFLSDQPEIAGRARRMLVGSETQGPHYDPNAGKLVDKLRGIRAKVDQLPRNPIEVDPYQDPKQVQPKLKDVPTQQDLDAKLKPAPQPVAPKAVPSPEIKPDAQPMDIRAVKQAAVEKAAANLKYLNKWQLRAALGMAGGAVGAAFHGNLGMAAGLAGSAVTTLGAPMILGSLIDLPRFKEWVADPSPHDFDILSKLKDNHQGLVADTVTGQILNMVKQDPRMRIAPGIRKFVGSGNTRKIAQAIAAGGVAAGAASQNDEKDKEKKTEPAKTEPTKEPKP